MDSSFLEIFFGRLGDLKNESHTLKKKPPLNMILWAWQIFLNCHIQSTYVFEMATKHFEYLRMFVSIDLIFTFNLRNITNFNFAAVTSLNIAKGRKRTPQ